MSSTISPNMSLIVPGVGTELGPTWAQDLNADLSILDQHNHSAGQGVQIGPNGININADLPFNSHNATLLRTVRFSAQSAAITNASPDQGCLYVVGNELYYNDVTGGHQVPITANGSVNAGAGSITGLPSGTASATYSAGTFTWQQATAMPATMDMGPIITRNPIASGKGVTIAPPNALAANYSLALPSAIAATNGSIIQSDTSGNLSYTLVDNSSLQNVSNVLAVKALGVTRAMQAAVGQQISSSCGSFTTSSATFVAVTNLTVTITVTGRPVIIVMQPDGTTIPTGSNIGNTGANATAINLFRSPSSLATWVSAQSGGAWVDGSSRMYVDPVSSGTYTYSIRAAAAAGTASVTNMVLMAYEL